MRGALVSMLGNSGALTVNTGTVGSTTGPQRHAVGAEAEGNAGSAKADVDRQHPGVSVGSIAGAVASAASASPEQNAQVAATKSGLGDVAANAQSGGSYAGQMHGSGISVNQDHFNAEGAKIDAGAHADMQKLHDSKLDSMTPALNDLQSHDANKGWTRDGIDETITSAQSADWKNSLGVTGKHLSDPGLSKAQAMYGQESNGQRSSRADNAQYGDYVRAVESGQFTHGVPQSHDFAQVYGAVLATHYTKEGLSASQGDQVKAAEGRLSPDQTKALNDKAHDISRLHTMPGKEEMLVSNLQNEAIPGLKGPAVVKPITDGVESQTPPMTDMPQENIDAQRQYDKMRMGQPARLGRDE
jgi:hypothetical protein